MIRKIRSILLSMKIRVIIVSDKYIFKHVIYVSKQAEIWRHMVSVMEHHLKLLLCGKHSFYSVSLELAVVHCVQWVVQTESSEHHCHQHVLTCGNCSNGTVGDTALMLYITVDLFGTNYILMNVMHTYWSKTILNVYWCADKNASFLTFWRRI